MTTDRVPIVDLKRQYRETRALVDAAVRRVLESGYYISGGGGPEVRAFEAEFAAYCGSEHAVAMGSGSAALNLTLRALGVGPGDEVVAPAFTLSAPLDAIVDLGARPVLVDVDPETYTLDPNRLESALTRRTKAVLPVHIYGHPADMDVVLSLAAPRGIPVVADACEAHGTLYRGRPVASLAAASCFSFYPTKNLNALGDAGGVVTNDAGLAERLRRLRHHGWDRRFHSAEPSLNSRMDEVHAAVLRARLPGLDAANERRRAIARRYAAALAGGEVRAAPHAKWASPSYYLYVIASARRDDLKAALDRAGIDSDVYWPEPPHLQPAFAGLGYARGSLPVTESLCERVLAIPMFPEMNENEVDRVSEALGAFTGAGVGPAP